MKAVCLISGGIDSAVTAAIAKSRGFAVHALTFDYGQRHKKEIECAKSIAKWLGANHKIIRIDLAQLGGSALTSDIEIETGKTPDEIKSSPIPATYVPARNTIFLSFALAYAETIGADVVFIGANAVDYSGYPDCRPEYIEAFQRMADLATKRAVEGAPIKIEAPILNLDKAQIIKKGKEMGVPFEKTWSCYKGGKKACGVCASCVLRLDGFKRAGVGDGVEYE
ncbi:MAG: 7-cyano-7-deazaguanine synthase QueC [Candidatus Altiarchaeales archaeon IMC4]|nr:MAG: 7-cyano-7-deazaguanine synthase QueC [Candidatus Altiarchaeales archaeon IMC4]